MYMSILEKLNPGFNSEKRVMKSTIKTSFNSLFTTCINTLVLHLIPYSQIRVLFIHMLYKKP